MTKLTEFEETNTRNIQLHAATSTRIDSLQEGFLDSLPNSSEMWCEDQVAPVLCDDCGVECTGYACYSCGKGLAHSEFDEDIVDNKEDALNIEQD